MKEPFIKLHKHPRRPADTVASRLARSWLFAWGSGVQLACGVAGLRVQRKEQARFVISRHALGFLFAWLLCALAHEAQAQWIQQQIVLKPGWNSVFLEVDPAPAECDALFAGLPIESVWDWNRTMDPVQFVQDPGTLIPGAPGWLTWFPPSGSLASQSSLFVLRDGRPYLIKVADSAAVTTWTVTGKPSLRKTEWQVGRANFVGFHVDDDSSLTFANLFAGEAGLVGQPVYRLGSAGVWEPILNLASAVPKRGEAYWIRCRAPATRSGTIEVDPGSRKGLVFGRSAVERSVRIRNTSIGPRTISLRALASVLPPVEQPPMAGAVPLEYRDANYAQARFDWKPLTDTLTVAELAPGAEWNVRLAVRRTALSTALAGAEFQSLIEVADDAGTRWFVPVSAVSGGTPVATSPFQSSSNGSSDTWAGLWIGDALLNAVSQPAHSGDPNRTRVAGGDFQLRLIVHVDGTGTASLLQHVFLVRKPPTFKPDPENPGFNILDQPGRTVVVTDEALIPQIIGTADIVGRRVSSVAFGFEQPLALAGDAFGTGALNGTVTLDYDHPLNPFKHIYHPDHNNLDERFEQKLPEGKESFSVTRSLSLEFAATDPAGLNPPGWGETELGGTYRETITGIHRSAIQVSGDFRLVRVSPAAALNQ
jgi:hypothetical protein